jgi:hypothetical protein
MASPAPAAGEKKILGMKPRTALISGGVILAAAIAWFWWKGRQSSPSSSATSSSASASAYSNAGQLDAIQEELDELLSQEGSSAGSGTGSSTTGTGSAAGSGSSSGGSGTTTTTPPPATTTTTAPPPKTTTTPPPKTTAKPKPAMPSGVRETKVTASSVTLTWAKTANATSYRVRVTYQGKLVGAPHLTTGTSVTVSGLGANRTYTFHVAAIGPGGTSSETNGPAVKTKL